MDKLPTRYLPGIHSQLALVVGSVLLGTLTVIAQMALISMIVSRVFLDNAQLAALEVPMLLLLTASAARAALTGIHELLAKRMAIGVTSTLRSRFFDHLVRLGPAYSRDERTGELITTAVEGVERLDVYVSRYLPQVLLSVFIPLVIAAAVALQDAMTAVLLVVTAPIIPLLMIIIGRYAEVRVQRQWEGLTRMGAHFLDAVQGLPTLLLFGRAEAENLRIARISERFRERTMRVLRTAFLSGVALEFMITCAIGVVAVTLGVRLLNGDIPFARAFFVLLLTPEFYKPIRDLGTQHHAGMEGKAAMAQIAEILDTPLPTSSQHAHARSEIPSAPDGLLTLELRNVSYTYPDGNHLALDKVCLTLRAGTCTALVGKSGAGKSTLANVLLRFIDAQGGMVIANGLAIDTLPPEIWRRYVAFVPQHPYLFAGTVRENLRLARPAASDAEIVRAATLAGADQFIRALPQGYDAPLGERGARLSAGQAQRIAIARAFLKDAPLLILDEPTSHLDPESESIIRGAMRALMCGRTVLVVAHRVNTIMAAEQIAVLDHGRIVETGTPTDLLLANGAYARLAERARTSLSAKPTEMVTDMAADGAPQHVNALV